MCIRDRLPALEAELAEVQQQLDSSVQLQDVYKRQTRNSDYLSGTQDIQFQMQIQG